MKSIIKKAKTWMSGAYLGQLSKSAPNQKKLENEAKRLEALSALKITYSTSEERFDRITQLTARTLDFPICMLNLITKEEQISKSVYGTDLQKMPRNLSFCSYTIAADRILEIPDMLKDPLFKNHPLVVKPPKIRYYAGHPLHSTNGQLVGSLCLVDKKPRELTADQKKTLAGLASWVELELNHQNLSKSLEIRKQLEHDLKQSHSQLKKESLKLKRALKEGKADYLEQELRYEALFDNSPLASLVFQKQKLILLNNQAETIFTPEIINLHLSKVLARIADVKTAKKITTKINKLKTQKAPVVTINCELISNQRIFPAEIRIFRLKLNGKSAIQLLIKDRTKELSAEEKSAEIAELKNRFISVVSHQLRTPLNAVKWNLEYVLEDKQFRELAKDIFEFLNDSYSANQQVLDRISELLIALAIEENQIKLELTPTNVQKLLTPIFKNWEETLLTKNIEFSWDKKSLKQIPKLNLDQNKFSYVINAIIKNAFQYTETGHVKIKIEPLKKHLKISIEDSGISVNPNDVDKIFESFFRCKEAIKIFPDASGLGLYICQHYINCHNGGITCEALKNGTRFNITIPYKQKSN